MRKRIYALISLLCLFYFSLSMAGKALLLTIDGPIGPATQDYIQHGLEQAARRDDIVILRMNTPGGLDSSMRGIVEAIMASPVPVVTYVAPAGSRAASAGTFILYASHLAIMAPGTNVGAASPIRLGEPASSSTTEQKKMVNDAAAYIRSLAELRERNAEWAELAVRNGASLSATDAKRLNVIDGLASDYPQLLQQIDGHTVFLVGSPEKINTKNIDVQDMPPGWRYQFLSFLTHPDIAYLFVLVAFYGLFFELANPGLILPGIAGIICLLLSLYAFQLMPINYAGLTLLLIGIGLMVFEAYVSTFGIAAIGGIIAFILGSILLFNPVNPAYQLSPLLVFSMSIMTVAFSFAITTLAVSAMRRKVITGQEGLADREGIVTHVEAERLTVQVGGEHWQAQSTDFLSTGDKVKIIRVEGLVLHVKSLNKPE